MTEERIAQVRQAFVEMAEAVRRLADAFTALAQNFVVQVMLILRSAVVFMRRCGFYCWMDERLPGQKVAWWLAWRLPDSWVLKLPTRWVYWTI